MKKYLPLLMLFSFIFTQDKNEILKPEFVKPKDEVKPDLNLDPQRYSFFYPQVSGHWLYPLHVCGGGHVPKTPFPTDIPSQAINLVRSRSAVLIKNPPINVMKTGKR